MTKLDKLLATATVAALFGVGLAVAPHEAFAAGSKDPSVPASMKVSNPCAPKATGGDKSGTSAITKEKSEKSRDKFDYPLLSDYMAKPQG